MRWPVLLRLSLSDPEIWTSQVVDDIGGYVLIEARTPGRYTRALVTVVAPGTPGAVVLAHNSATEINRKLTVHQTNPGYDSISVLTETV